MNVPCGHGRYNMRVFANLFDIVHTGQHPNASVVEDGEFLRQLLLAGLDHSPRHLRPVRLKFQSGPGKKYHESPQAVARKQRKRKGLTSVFI